MTHQTFTVRGGRNGSQVHVTWTDGRLSGDPPTVDLVEVEAELASLHPHDRQSWSHVSHGGAALPGDPLSDPEATWRLIVSVLDTLTGGEGDLPAAAVEALSKSRRR